MKVKEVLEKTTNFFKEKKFETARLDAEILLTKALGFKDRVDLYIKFDQPLKETEIIQCREFVKRRSQGEPVAYITQEKYFFGFPFYVDRNVLVPRPETEILVEEAISWIKNNFSDQEEVTLLDLGTGSGCIGLSIAKTLPNVRLTLVDVSESALAVAQKNAQNLELQERTHFVLTDARHLSEIKGSFDVVLANPPYISENDPATEENVKRHEPHQALFSGDNGMLDFKCWVQQCVPFLKEKAFVGFEMGYQQGQQGKEVFESLHVFDTVYIKKDLAGLDRHTIGIKKGLHN